MLNFAFEIYKIKNGLSTKSMNIFDNIKPVTYDLRKKQQNILPKVNTTTYGQKSFRYYASHLWNQIPDNIKDAANLQCFKSLLMSWNSFTCTCIGISKSMYIGVC